MREQGHVRVQPFIDLLTFGGEVNFDHKLSSFIVMRGLVSRTLTGSQHGELKIDGVGFMQTTYKDPDSILVPFTVQSADIYTFEDIVKIVQQVHVHVNRVRVSAIVQDLDVSVRQNTARNEIKERRVPGQIERCMSIVAELAILRRNIGFVGPIGVVNTF